MTGRFGVGDHPFRLKMTGQGGHPRERPQAQAGSSAGMATSRARSFCAEVTNFSREKPGPLQVFLSALGEVEGWQPRRHWELLEHLGASGFRTNPANAWCQTIEEVEAACTTWDTRRLSYEVDRVVVKLGDLGLQEELGAVGRTGVLTRRAILAPATIRGARVTYATLHNLGDIRRKDLHIGDTMFVKRAGEVIPAVVAPVLEQRRPEAVPWANAERLPVVRQPGRPARGRSRRPQVHGIHLAQVALLEGGPFGAPRSGQALDGRDAAQIQHREDLGDLGRAACPGRQHGAGEAPARAPLVHPGPDHNFWVSLVIHAQESLTRTTALLPRGP